MVDRQWPKALFNGGNAAQWDPFAIDTGQANIIECRQSWRGLHIML